MHYINLELSNCIVCNTIVEKGQNPLANKLYSVKNLWKLVCDIIVRKVKNLYLLMSFVVNTLSTELMLHYINLKLSNCIVCNTSRPILPESFPSSFGEIFPESCRVQFPSFLPF